MKVYRGRCLCGACQYEITDVASEAMFCCHCSRCRRETGTASAANLFISKACLLWNSGQEQIRYFSLEGTKKQKSFCNICGSPLPRVEGDTHIVVPVGTLDSDIDIKPTAHIFYESRARWEDCLHELKRFDKLPDIDV